MKDPVQGNDGHTYERVAILEWLRRNPISPQTRQPMNESDLKVNASIRFLCDKYHRGEFGVSVKRESPKISTHHISLNHNQYTNSSNNKYMINFDIDPTTFPQTECKHLSQDIVLVIDRSGSMGLSVEAKNANGDKLENGFSIQDIVNHAAKTVAKTLDKNSRLAIVIYDNNVEVVYELQIMSEINKSTAMGIINTIAPRGQTNLWGGTTAAIKILDDRDDKSRNGVILVFTDGAPNISPARGEVETLKQLRTKKNFTSPIYTFGFGYGVQRELLYDMAKYANGGNGHIPDGNMIATVFCNFIATMLCTVVVNLQLHIITPNVSIMGV